MRTSSFQAAYITKPIPPHFQFMEKLGSSTKIRLGNLDTIQTIVTAKGLRDTTVTSNLADIFTRWQALRTDGKPMRTEFETHDLYIVALDFYQQTAVLLSLLESQGIKGIELKLDGSITVPDEAKTNPLLTGFGFNNAGGAYPAAAVLKSSVNQRSRDGSFWTGQNEPFTRTNTEPKIITALDPEPAPGEAEPSPVDPFEQKLFPISGKIFWVGSHYMNEPHVYDNSLFMVLGAEI